MKAITVIVLICLAASVQAADCGQTLNEARVKRLRDSLNQTNGTVLEHMKSLSNELSNMPSGNAYDRLSLEHDRVRAAYDVAFQLEGALDRIEMLVVLRDLMLYPKDKQTLVQVLSITAYHTRKTSEQVQEELNRGLSSRGLRMSMLDCPAQEYWKRPENAFKC